MKIQQIKFKSFPNNYSIIIGNNILSILPKKIKILCPKVKKIALIVDKNVPYKIKSSLKNRLKKYELIFLNFHNMINLIYHLQFLYKSYEQQVFFLKTNLNDLKNYIFDNIEC